MSLNIDINGKRVLLNEIGSFTPRSDFEETTVAFISEWLEGKEHFSIFTSGSTGTPKEISINRRQMEASARFTIEALALKPGENALVCLDTKYIAGKMMLVRALVNQMNIIVRDPEANPLTGLTVQPDFVALVPLQLHAILASKGSMETLNAMKAVIIGGAPVTAMLQSAIGKLNVPVYATYGMTETVSHIALKRLNGPDASPYYTAFDEVKIGKDSRGCLTIQSVLTDHQQVVTNDRITLHGDQQFEWLGRIDNVINTGGIKVQSEKVERAVDQALAASGISLRFFVTGIPDEKLGEKIVLVVESPAAIQEGALLEKLKSRLTKYELPRQIVTVARFSETATGKIQRSATIKQYSLR